MNTRFASGARLIIVAGRVQGVGFRPFVYRLAHRLGIAGWVQNASGEVRIAARATCSLLDSFERKLIAEAPPLARPYIKSSETIAAFAAGEFCIRASTAGDEADIHVPPDQFACDDCLVEMTTPGGHRFGYPFINCTQCGPRYTIIRAMPYDRPNTTMDAFPLCDACSNEYGDPLDRRFHAQPLACNECGPSLTYEQGGTRFEGNEISLAQCVADLRSGRIVAIKGIGGYHLVCDAANAVVVNTLRQRKARPSKPLAVMVPWAGDDGLMVVQRIASPTPAQASRLLDPIRPIVLVAKKTPSMLADAIAPGLDEVGVMLPYSPLHHLLLNAFAGPLIATSGNVSGEPVTTDPHQARQRLAGIADNFMHHDRPIQRPADDPVLREIAGAVRPIRLGRGNAPLELDFPFHLDEPMLATGGFLKNTIALAWGDRAVISPHIGDLASKRGRDVFEQLTGDLPALYGVTATSITCDAHPGYPNTRWARDTGLPVTRVQHHKAHASALAGEFGLDGPMIVFTWDGVGLGEDDTAWGGEAMVGRPGDWRREASFRPFRLPGGDRAALAPWRTALSLAWHCNAIWPGAPQWPPLLREAWDKGVNSPPCSAVGRLFDAAAAFAGLVHESTWEGQAPIMLEAAATETTAAPIQLPLARDTHGVWRADWTPLVRYMLNAGAVANEIAVVFHESMAHSLYAQARILRDIHHIGDVGLAGGVFQNRRLTERACQLLQDAGFSVYIPRQLPLNDAGISYGQLVEAAARRKQGIQQ